MFYYGIFVHSSLWLIPSCTQNPILLPFSISHPKSCPFCFVIQVSYFLCSFIGLCTSGLVAQAWLFLMVQQHGAKYLVFILWVRHFGASDWAGTSGAVQMSRVTLCLTDSSVQFLSSHPGLSSAPELNRTQESTCKHHTTSQCWPLTSLAWGFPGILSNFWS